MHHDMIFFFKLMKRAAKLWLLKSMEMVRLGMIRAIDGLKIIK